MFKVNNKHLKERRHLSLAAFTTCSCRVSTVDFEQLKIGWMTIIHCPAGIYLFIANNRNSTTRNEICSKLTINIPERCQ